MPSRRRSSPTCGAKMASPWRTNPIGELLCSLYLRFAKAEFEEGREPPYPIVDPIIRTPVFRFCKECKTGTEHQVFDWVVEGIETEECTKCLTTKVIS